MCTDYKNLYEREREREGSYFINEEESSLIGDVNMIPADNELNDV